MGARRAGHASRSLLSRAATDSSLTSSTGHAPGALSPDAHTPGARQRTVDRLPDRVGPRAPSPLMASIWPCKPGCRYADCLCSDSLLASLATSCLALPATRGARAGRSPLARSRSRPSSPPRPWAWRRSAPSPPTRRLGHAGKPDRLLQCPRRRTERRHQRRLNTRSRAFRADIYDLQTRLNALESSLGIERNLLLNRLKSQLQSAHSHLTQLKAQLITDKRVLGPHR